VRLRHDTPVVRASFDDPNLVSCAGLVPVMRLAQQAGLHDAVVDRVRLPGDKGSNPAGKVAAIVAGMLAGADSIDDLDVARHGGMPSLFTRVYAPSTIGSFLRALTHGHVRQLQAAARDTLVGLTGRTPVLAGADVLCFLDIDSMLRRVYGRQKQGISVTCRIDAKVRAACESIAEQQWIDIRYPQAVWDDDAGRWISDAQIAETTYTAFEGTRHAVTARLIVRRIRRDDPAQHPGQEELLPAYRYHAVFTDSPYTLVQAESQHRAHAIIEQVNADLIAGPLAHLPSGRFAANDAWLACAAIAHNLTRAAGHLAGGGYQSARPATIRTRLVTVAARLAHRARTIHLHLPGHWPWQAAFDNLFTAVHPAPG
jgi:hypothetical protein